MAERQDENQTSTQVRIANVTVYDLPQYAQQPTLWCRSTTQVVPSEHKDGTQSATLPKGGSYDFMTYFNALSIKKWREYTSATAFRLVLNLRGSGSVRLTQADTLDYVPRDLTEPVEFAQQGRKPAEVIIDVPSDTDGNPSLVGFTIEASPDANVTLLESWWEADVPEGAVRDVVLSVGTTTFKKEEYVLRNVALFDRYLANSKDEAIRSSVYMHVVDNGRTLAAEDVEIAPTIRLHPNPNAGGAGGFARGMLESMWQEPKATHVLLMDDDVQISPEALIRTFNLLRIVNDEWKDAFVEGAMLSMLEPEQMHEDTGFMNAEGFCVPEKFVLKCGQRLTLSRMNDLARIEEYDRSRYEGDEPAMAQEYGAWWFCCIPMTRIEELGLPIPMFVRFDDVEFGLRRSPKIMTMLGINVWHSPFFLRYDGAVERYQVAKNACILKSVAPEGTEITSFDETIYRMVQLELKRFNYDNAELVLAGLEDYLAGPERTFAPGFAEERFMWSHKQAEQLRPIEDMRDELAELGIDADVLNADVVERGRGRSLIDKVFDFVSFNGQRIFKDNYTQAGKVAIMDFSAGTYNPGVIRQAETIVAVDLQNRKAAIRHKDIDRFNEIWTRYRHISAELEKRREELDGRYLRAAEKMRTVGAWCDYLGIEEPPADGE